MAEKITQIQIGADVRDIGLGMAASVEVHKYVIGTTAKANLGLGTDAYWRLYPLLGDGLRLSTDAKKRIMIDTAFTASPGALFQRSALLSFLNIGSGLKDDGVKVLVNHGSGLVFDNGNGKVLVNLGSGLVFDNGKVVVNVGYGLEYDYYGGPLNVNLGSGLMFDTDGSGKIRLNVTPGRGIVINPANFSFTLDTSVACRMLTAEGDGSVISLDSGLGVNYGSGLTMSNGRLEPQLSAGLTIVEDSPRGIGVRLGTAMCFGGDTAEDICVDIYTLLNEIKNDTDYLNTLKRMLGLS